MEFLRPLTSSAPIERVRRQFRRKVRAWNADREMSPDMENARAFLSSEAMRAELARLR
jgi:histidine ammonia-lyase